MLLLAAIASADPVPASDLEIWLRFAGTIAAIIGTGVAGFWATRTRLDRVENVTNAGAISAKVAAELADPGFSTSVLESLDELKQRQIEIAGQLARHLEDHAASDLRRPHRA